LAPPKILAKIHHCFSSFVAFYKIVNRQSHVNKSKIVIKWL